MNLVLKAFDFAKTKHEGQTRKVSGLPYVTHPITVSYLVAAFKRSKRLEELLAASILHDTLEDTKTDFEEIEFHFGIFVATLVLELTNDPKAVELYGKLEYQKNKMISMTSYALVIKLADRLSNMMDNPSTQMVYDTLELLKYITDNRKLSKTHLALIDAIYDTFTNAKTE